MGLQGKLVELLFVPAAYSAAQIKRALRIAAAIGRGKLVLTEEPARCPVCLDDPETFCVYCGKS